MNKIKTFIFVHQFLTLSSSQTIFTNFYLVPEEIVVTNIEIIQRLSCQQDLILRMLLGAAASFHISLRLTGCNFTLHFVCSAIHVFVYNLMFHCITVCKLGASSFLLHHSPSNVMQLTKHSLHLLIPHFLSSSWEFEAFSI